MTAQGARRQPRVVAPRLSGLRVLRWRTHDTVCVRLHVGDLLERRHGSQLVTTVVVAVRGMPFRPGPFGFVPLNLFVELAPKVLVGDRLLAGGHPALAFPSVDPGRDAVLEVIRI